MKLLLNTHALFWWDNNQGLLSPTVLSAINDPANEVWFSVVNVWEMLIKWNLGKLSLRIPLPDLVAEQQANGLRLLNVELAPVLAIETLPPAHKEPFDRLLAAQAIVLDAELVTNDHIFAHYPVRTFW